MSNRVVIQIAGQELVLLVDEDVQYLNKVAAFVDQKVGQVVSETRMSLLNATMLTCMNIADEYFKAMDQAENLRRQLKEYIEESAKSKTELAELKKETGKGKKDSQ